MAYSFDGVNQYLSTATTPVTAYPFSFAAWFYANNTNGGIVMALQRVSDVSRATMFLGDIDAGNTQRLIAGAVPTSAGVNANCGTTTQYSPTTWSQASAQHTSLSSFLPTLNGGGKPTPITQTGTMNAWTQLSIGARNNGTSWGSYFSGRIASAAMWDVVISDDEIKSLAKGFKPHRIRPQSLVFYAPMIRDLNDVRGGRTITNNNTATVAVHPRVI